MIEQLTMSGMLGIKEEAADKNEYIVDSFSADGFCPENARQELEKNMNRFLRSQRSLTDVV